MPFIRLSAVLVNLPCLYEHRAHQQVFLSANGSRDHGCGPVRVLRPRSPPIATVHPIQGG